MKHKNLVIIQTPVSSTVFTQVTCLMSDEEFEEAKQERPDLVFMLASELPVEAPKQEPLPVPVGLRDDQGITVTGMTLPANIDELIEKVLEDK